MGQNPERLTTVVITITHPRPLTSVEIFVPYECLCRHIFLEDTSSSNNTTPKGVPLSLKHHISPMHGKQNIRFGVWVPKVIRYA